MTTILVFLYLIAIVAANLAAATFGPSATPVIAFFLVAFDLTSRDLLHSAWQGRGLQWRMPLLIAIGGLLSYALNASAGRIAIASCVAFAAAGVADALVYHALRRRSWVQRANGSNVVGALIDSALFVTIAFNAWLPLIILAQFAAKTAGGALWAYILSRTVSQKEVLQ